jgi:hypothetical protein
MPRDEKTGYLKYGSHGLLTLGAAPGPTKAKVVGGSDDKGRYPFKLLEGPRAGTVIRMQGRHLTCTNKPEAKFNGATQWLEMETPNWLKPKGRRLKDSHSPDSTEDKSQK